MIVRPRYRQLLEQGVAPATSSPLARGVEARLRDDGATDAGIATWRCRLWLYTGEADRAVRELARALPMADGLDRNECRYVAQQLQLLGYGGEVAPIRTHVPAELRIRYLLMDASVAMHIGDLGEARRALSGAAEALIDSPTGTQDVLIARLARRKAELDFRSGDVEEALARLVMAALTLLCGRPDRGFLEQEALRRLSGYGFRLAMLVRNWRAADELASAAVAADPTCPQAMLMVAVAKQRMGDKKAFVTYCSSAADHGHVEHPFATALLHGDSTRATPFGEESLPEPSTCKLGSREQIEAVPAFADLSHFWTLERASLTSLARWSSQCLHAHELFTNRAAPYFQSLHFQATPTIGLRRRLVEACGPGYLPMPTSSWGLRLDSILDASPYMRSLGTALSQGDTADPIGNSGLARVLCYLGFPDEAAGFLRGLLGRAERRHGSTGAHAPLVDTYLFADYLVRMEPSHLTRAWEALDRLSTTDLTARTHLSVSIRALGLAGKLERVNQAQRWRLRAEEALRRYAMSNEVGEDEQLLMTSRFWRAACFVPMLGGDMSAARSEVDRYVAIAREIESVSEIHAENMYATLETEARFLQRVGDFKAAESRFEELVRRVDPLDSKAWVNYADCVQARGDHRTAAELFIYAAHLGPPLDDLAWFRAGVCLRSAGMLDAAINAHLRAIESSPCLLTPLQELRDLCGSLRHRRFLVSWANERLVAMASDFER